MKIEDIKKMARAWNQVQEASYGKKKEAMDPVDKSELKGKHKDRKDKDIDNDGDVDSSDKYLHKRRKAVSKAIASKDKEVEVQTQESVDEASNHGNMNNGSPAGEGLSPSAKKELDRTSPTPAVDQPTVDKKTFDTIRASGKKAPMRSNDNAAGDKTAPKTGK